MHEPWLRRAQAFLNASFGRAISLGNAAWSGTVERLAAEIDEDLEGLIRTCSSRLSASSQDQLAAWRASFPLLVDVLENVPHELTISLEYRLPMSNERCDVVLIGRSPAGGPRALVLEMKGWSRIDRILNAVVEADGRKRQHPEWQTSGYVGKLRFSHSAAGKFDFLGCAWLYRLSESSLRFSEGFPAFWEGQSKRVSEFTQQQLPEPLSTEQADEFLNGRYVQSPRFFEAIAKHYDELRRGALEALVGSGWEPSEEQQLVLEDILETVTRGEQACYLVRGPPGSGKSYLAVLLLLMALKNLPRGTLNREKPKHGRAVLGYRNNRLINTLRQVFAQREKGLDAAIRFYSTARERGGLAEGTPGAPTFETFDLTIYDEAQRMTKPNIEIALQRAPVTAFFYDDSQILNADEQGWTGNFETEATGLGLRIEKRELQGYYRVHGGEQYHEFVETLLATPSKARLPQDLDYEFRVFPDILEMLGTLSARARLPNTRVALVAAFTESPGDRDDKTGKTPKNLRIGHPLYSGFDRYRDIPINVYWLMDEKTQYPAFWYKGDCNNLSHCASIYGCQGFEADYAGIIWGRDLTHHNGTWRLGHNCEDNIGRPGLKKLFERASRGDKQAELKALQLLVNRYRIFLTRGISGTLIYCEDDETANFLQSLSRTSGSHQPVSGSPRSSKLNNSGPLLNRNAGGLHLGRALNSVQGKLSPSGEKDCSKKLACWNARAVLKMLTI